MPDLTREGLRAELFATFQPLALILVHEKVLSREDCASLVSEFARLAADKCAVVVAEARRAQRKADVKVMCLRCQEDIVPPVRRKDARGWWHVNFARGDWTECRASAIRAQEETP